MAANDEILGIGAHMDIGDIQRSFTELIESLDKIGVKTDVLSKQMNEALVEIARSSDDSATKQKRAMEVLAHGLAEAKNALANYPEQLRQAKNEADATAQATARLEAQLVKMKEQLNGVAKGSDQYQALKASIAGVEQQIINNNHAQEAQLTTIQEMEAGYNSLVQLYGFTTAATMGQVAAKTLETGATTAASIAHEKNAEVIAKESQSLAEQKDTVQDIGETLQKASYDNTPIGSSIATIEENLKRLREENEKLKASLENSVGDTSELQEMDRRYQANIETIQKLSGELDKLKDVATMGYKSMEEYNEAQKKTAEKLDPAAAKAYWEAIRETGERATTYFEMLPTLLERIRGHLKEINETPQNAAFLGEMQSLVEQLSKATSAKDFLNNGDAERGLSSLADKFEKLSDSEEKLMQMAQEDPWKVQGLSLSELNQRIDESKAKLAQYEAELEKMRSKKGFSETSKEAEELKMKIEMARKEQELLNKELEGRPGYQKFFGNLRERFKGLSQDIKNTFSQIKGSFSGGEKGIGGIFSLLTSGKFLGWTAAIGAAGGAIKGLSDSAERLKLALDPLRSYVDADVLGKLRDSFIETALAGSAQSTEDMAAAALHWVKYYESIRNVPEAIQHVVDASRELATISGTSAEKAADTLTKLGGQFHLTADEAMKSVNILVNASRESVVSITELMQSLTSSGARINQNGASLKEYAAAVSLASAQYGGASQAASAYQRILQRLSTETNDNFNPKVVGATKAFQNLQKEMENGTDLSAKFGKMIWSQAQYFIKNADAIAEYTDKLDSATGKENALARAEEKAAYNKSVLSNALSALAQSINLNLTPAFVRIVQGITSFVEWCGKAIQKTGELKDSISSWLGLGGDKTPKIRWDAGNTREQYRRMLRDGGNPLTASAQLIAAYKKSDSSGISIEDVREIIRQENDQWKIAHPALQSATTKGVANTVGKDNSVDDKKALQAAENRVKKEEDLAKRRRKYQQGQIQQAKDAEIAEWEARIAAMKDGSAKVEQEAEKEYQKRLNQIEAQERQMLEKNIEYAAQEYDKNKKKGEAGFYSLGLDKNVTLNETQNRQIQAEREKANADHLQSVKKRIEEERKANQSAVNDYLRQFGDYTQKKQVIYQEANDKICEIEESLSKDSTQEARDAAEARIAIVRETAKRQVDELDVQYGKAKAFMIDLFEDASLKSIAEMEKIIAKYEELVKFLKGDGSVSRDDLKSLGFSDKQIDQALSNVKEKGVEAIKAITDGIKQMKGDIGGRSPWKRFSDDITKSIKKLKEANGDMSKIGSGIEGIGNAALSILPQVSQLSNTLASTFGFDDSDIQSVIGGLGGMANTAMGVGQIMSGDVAGGIMNAINGISQMVGAMEGLGLWSNSNRAEVEAANNKLTQAMSVNSEAVNRLTDAMEKANPEEAFKTYEQAVAAMRANEQAQRQMMVNNAYMYDGGRSLNYDLGGAGNTIRDIFSFLKMTPNGAYDLGGLLRTLSASDWNRLYSNERGRDLLKRLGEAIAEAEDDGNYNGIFQDILNFANSYSQEVFDELSTKFLSAVTNVSFDSVYDNFVNMIMDLDKTAEDFANDFEGYLRNAVYQSLASTTVKPLLDGWYRAFAAYMRNDNRLDSKEIDKLMNGGGSYVDENGVTQTFSGFESIKQAGLALREEIERLGLFDGSKTQSQNATVSAMERITVDQADELIGRMNAGQIIWQQQLDSMLTLIGSSEKGIEYLSQIGGNIRDIASAVASVVDMQRTGNAHLAAIERNTSPIAEISSEIYKIRKLVEQQ